MNLERFPFRTMQVTIALIVGCSAIWFQETYAYPINPMVVGVWMFLASYGATLLVGRLALWQLSRTTLPGDESSN